MLLLIITEFEINKASISGWICKAFWMEQEKPMGLQVATLMEISW